MSQTIIGAQNLTAAYGSTTALKGVSLSVEKGEIFGLLGPNGAGKSTLLACVEGCLLYTSPSPRDRTRSRMPSSA